MPSSSKRAVVFGALGIGLGAFAAYKLVGPKIIGPSGLPPIVPIDGWGGLEHQDVGSTLTPWSGTALPLLVTPNLARKAIPLPVDATGNLTSPWIVAKSDPSDKATVSGSTLTLLDGSGGLYTAHGITATLPNALPAGGFDLVFDSESTGSGTKGVYLSLYGETSPISVHIDVNGGINVSAGGDSASTTRARGLGFGRPGPGNGGTIRVLAQPQGSTTTIRVKAWAGTAEPSSWNTMIWQTPNYDIRNMSGGISISIADRAEGWTLSNIHVAPANPLPATVAPSAKDPISGWDIYNVDTELGIPMTGEAVDMEVSNALMRLPTTGAVARGNPSIKLWFPYNAEVSGLQNVKIDDWVIGRPPQFAPQVYTEAVPFLRLNGCRNTTVDSNEIAGEQQGWLYDRQTEGESGIWIEGGQSMTVSNNLIHHVGGDSIFYRNASDGVIEYNDGYYCRRQGITPEAGSVVMVRFNRLHNIGRSIFDLEPLPNSSIHQCTLYNNLFATFTNYAFALGGQELIGSHQDIVMDHNQGTGGVGFVYAPEVGASNPLQTGLAITNNNWTWSDPVYKDPRNGTIWTPVYAPVVAQTNGVLTLTGNGFIGNSLINCVLEGASGQIDGNNLNNQSALVAYVLTQTSLTEGSTGPTIGTNTGNVVVQGLS